MRRSILAVLVFFFSLIPAVAQNPVPFVNQPVVPAAVQPGSAAFTLTVNGTGFVDGATVNWNGTPLTTTFVSASQLTAEVPASNVAKSSTALITVVNPSPGGGTSNPISFLITYPTTVLPFQESQLGFGSNATAVAVGDFNGDGNQDLAVASGQTSSENGAITIFLGNGDGTFHRVVTYSIGGPTGNVVASDFSGDGKLDLAVTLGTTPAEVAIFLGLGDGTFVKQTPIELSFSPLAMTAGDFNGDGHMDLAINSGSSVALLLGNGDGSFQAPLVSPSGGSGPIVAGDFNGDGILDLAGTRTVSGLICRVNCTPNFLLLVALGNGDGTFKPDQYYGETVYGGTYIPDSIVAADFNGNGILDWVVNGFFQSGGMGAVSAFSRIFLGPGGAMATTASNGRIVTAGDINGDGNLDLLATAFSSSFSISIVLGNGDGTFGNSINVGSSSSRTVALGDFNNDGKLDMVAGTSEEIVVFLQLAPVSFSPNPLDFGNQPVGVTTSAKTATLSNRTGATLNITSIEASGDYALASTSTSCPYSGGTVAAAGTCTIDVTFTPHAVGSQSGTVSVTDDSIPSPQVIQLTGGGASGSVTLSPSSLDFGVQLIGTSSASQTVTLTNSATTALSITSIAVSSGFTQTNNCGTGIAAGASCTISITFSPTPTSATPGTLTITDSAAGSPHTVTLRAIATAVTLLPASLDFGAVALGTTSPPQIITLTYYGSTHLTVDYVRVFGDFRQTNNCEGNVPAGQPCTISITFTPSAPGKQTGNLVVIDGDPSEQQEVTLTGTGNGPIVSLATTYLSFNDQATGTRSSPQVVLLTNDGNETLSVSSVSASGDFAQSNGCSTGVAPGGICIISVTFAPTSLGYLNGSITITDNASDSPQTIYLDGTGVQGPRVTLSPASLNFPVQYVGTTGLPQNVTLTNTGDQALTISNVQASSSFGFTNACTSNVAVGVSCSISVFFDPTTSGNVIGTLTITDDAPGSPHVVSVSGTGQDFNLGPAPGSTTTANINAGATATFNLSLAPAGGFNQTVSFFCTGAPALSTCTVNPTSATLGPGSAVNITVSVATTPHSRTALHFGLPPLGGLKPLMLGWLGLLAAWGFFVQFVRTRRRASVSLAALFFAGILMAALALPSCGGGSTTQPTPSGGTPSGTYHLTVTGTFTSGATTLSHNLQLTLTVN